MRTLFISMLIITCLSNISSLAQPDTRQLFEKKVKNYTHLRNAGWIAVGAGVCVFAGGIAVLADYFSEYPYDESKRFAGESLTTAGTVMIVTGFTIVGIGRHGRRTYKRRLDALSTGFIFKPNCYGFSLTYRF
jgi:predicted urease superfamily metal-dependent hydrolase